jgi:hypothetical protein
MAARPRLGGFAGRATKVLSGRALVRRASFSITSERIWPAKDIRPCQAPPTVRSRTREAMEELTEGAKSPTSPV